MNPWRPLANLPRAVVPLLVVTFVNRAGAMVIPFLALYLTRERRLEPTTAGLVVGCFGVVGLVSGPIAGRVAQRYGTRLVLGVSLIANGTLLLVYPAVEQLVPLLVLTAAWAFAAEAFSPAMLSLVAQAVDPSVHRQAYSAHRLAVNVGMAIGPAIGGILAAQSFSLLFVVDACTSFAAAVVLVWSRARGPAEVPQPLPQPHAAKPRGSFDRRYAFFLAGVVASGIVFFQSVSSMPLDLTTRFAASTSTLGMLYALSALLIVVFELALTEMLAPWSFRRTLITGAVLMAVGFGSFGVVRGIGGAAIAVTVWSVGEMVLFPTATAYVAALAPERRRPLAMGIYSAAWSVAFAIGPALGLSTLTRVGPTAHWLLVLAVGALAALFFAVAVGPAKETVDAS